MTTSRSYQPLERRKVYEQIAEQLLGRIGAGTFGRETPCRRSAS